MAGSSLHVFFGDVGETPGTCNGLPKKASECVAADACPGRRLIPSPPSSPRFPPPVAPPPICNSFPVSAPPPPSLASLSFFLSLANRYLSLSDLMGVLVSRTKARSTTSLALWWEIVAAYGGGRAAAAAGAPGGGGVAVGPGGDGRDQGFRRLSVDLQVQYVWNFGVAAAVCLLGL